MAWITFFEFPDVLIANKTSPFFPNARICCANAYSGTSSLQNALPKPIIEGSEIAGSAPCKFSESSGPSLSLISGEMSWFRKTFN